MNLPPEIVEKAQKSIWLTVMRHIERIADHACYIADSVVYIVEGEKLGLHWRSSVAFLWQFSAPKFKPTID
jgi:hypothetical protein